MARPDKPLPRVGALERAVLEHLWRVGEADVGETFAAVGAPRGITPNTVGSALERLYRKELLRRRKVSHAYRYEPALDPDEFSARRVLEAGGGIERLSRSGLLAAFVDLVAEADERALDRLEALIAERRKGR